MRHVRQVVQQLQLLADAPEDAHRPDGVHSVRLRLRHAPPPEETPRQRAWTDSREFESVPASQRVFIAPTAVTAGDYRSPTTGTFLAPVVGIVLMTSGDCEFFVNDKAARIVLYSSNISVAFLHFAVS